MCFELCNNTKKIQEFSCFSQYLKNSFFLSSSCLASSECVPFKVYAKRELCDLSLRNACATGDNI